MATIMCLPEEIIAIVLGYNDISIEDIMNFRCMWEQFPSTAKYDIDWERIFSQRWPSAKKHYDNQSKENEQDSEENEQKDKKSFNFIETGINCAKQLRDYVSQLMYRHYYDNISFDDFTNMRRTFDLIERRNKLYLDEQLINNFDEIIYNPENFTKYYFFIDEIKNLLTQSPRRTGYDLTERYCIIKFFHYMRQRSVIMKWDRFEEQPYREQLMERIATIVAQSIQPQKDIFYSCIKASLDSIAREVLNCLRKKHPDHSIFSTSAETFSYWKNNNIDDNHWNEAEGKQIMDILDEYIFGTLNFRLSKSKDKNSQYMCIDNVLENKYGHEIILLIIYHSVARRLGLRCDVIYPDLLDCSRMNYCILKPEYYARNSLENARCFNTSYKKFPDCFVNQLLNPIKHMSSYRNGDLLRKTAVQVGAITHIMGQMKRRLPDLGIVYNGVVITDNFNLCYNSFHRDENYWGCFIKEEKFITRPEDVKYAVGMQICTGQTYDIILTENNIMCLAEEDAITLTTLKWIDNIEIGRYFCKFEDKHYVPNKMLARLYPQDLRRYNCPGKI